MKISLEWLKDYLKFDEDYKTVSDILTNIGLEVENIEMYESVKGSLKGLVVGEVKECGKHPNADKLSVTRVDIGTGELLDIVCGAPNVDKGQKVIVAPVGTTLYKGNESLTIKKTKIRGELSQGMICAEDEIGLGTSHDGIMVLEDTVPVGTPANKVFKVYTDVVFEIGLTPNRIDSASHFGTARDMAAFLNLSKESVAKKPDVHSLQIDEKSQKIDVIIERADLCPRYSGVSLSGVKVKPSPDWLQNKLKAIGLSPINNIVDITNFVLHEFGQPLHAFDTKKIRGNKIVAKTLKDKTPFTTLDGEEHILSSEDLMICDGEGPVAIAGVFGGLHSGVTESTTEVFLESAYFNPTSVRKTSKRHAISTDSSFRFERGTDPSNTVYALKRAAILIKELAGGIVSSEIVDNYPRKISPVKIKVYYQHIDRLIGKSLEKNTIKKILNSLEISINHEDDDHLEVTVPLYRVDVTREADIIEEILRIYGYNNVEVSNKMQSTIIHSKKPDNEKISNEIADLLCHNGFFEIMSNSLTKSEYYKDLDTFKDQHLVYIYNPLSNDLNCMRQTLLFGGLESIVHNTNRKNQNLRLFEFGNCYFLNPVNHENPLKKYSEHRVLALFMTGKTSELNWKREDAETDFFDLKDFVEMIVDRITGKLTGIKLTKIENDIFHYGLSYEYNKDVLVNFGMVNKKITDKLEVSNNVFYASLHWDNLLKLSLQNITKFKEIPKYPEVKRDLALLINEHVSFDEIKSLALSVEKRLIKNISLFDIYQGENIGKGKKSYAVSFILQDEGQTLTDKNIDKIMNKLISAFQQNLNAQIR